MTTMKAFCTYIVAAIFLLALFGIRSVNGKLGKVIIDTDAGADDAIAIFLALQSEDKSSHDGFKVLAITCTYGNTYEENVEKNVLKILTVAGRSDIPVYGGAKKGFLPNFISDDYFGKDGLGDFNFTETPITSVDRSKHAAVALVDLVKQYPGQITLLNLGPLTNVATAIALEPSFLEYLHGHIILGGSVSGIGNVQPGVEYNFFQDPESNAMVLNFVKATPSILFPWETAHASSTSKEWRVNVLGKTNSRIVNFLNKAERISINKRDTWVVSDAYAAAVMIWPELILQATVKNVSPVIDGTARGTILVDYTEVTNKTKNVEIVQTFNVTAFKELLLKKFT